MNDEVARLQAIMCVSKEGLLGPVGGDWVVVTGVSARWTNSGASASTWLADLLKQAFK